MAPQAYGLVLMDSEMEIFVLVAVSPMAARTLAGRALAAVVIKSTAGQFEFQGSLMMLVGVWAGFFW